MDYVEVLAKKKRFSKGNRVAYYDKKEGKVYLGTITSSRKKEVTIGLDSGDKVDQKQSTKFVQPVDVDKKAKKGIPVDQVHKYIDEDIAKKFQGREGPKPMNLGNPPSGIEENSTKVGRPVSLDAPKELGGKVKVQFLIPHDDYHNFVLYAKVSEEVTETLLRSKEFLEEINNVLKSKFDFKGKDFIYGDKNLQAKGLILLLSKGKAYTDWAEKIMEEGV